MRAPPRACHLPAPGSLGPLMNPPPLSTLCGERRTAYGPADRRIVRPQALPRRRPLSLSPAPPPHEPDPVAGVVDPVWRRLRQEAEAVVRDEPRLASFLVATILNHGTLESAVAHRVASRLGHPALAADLI